VGRSKKLKLDAHNANKGTERGRAMVEASLRETGAGRSILVDKERRVIAGNKTLEAWGGLADKDNIQIVHTDGQTLVVVQRDDLDLDDPVGLARRLAYLDNRSSEVGLEWDAEEVLASIDAGFDINGLWDDDELKDLLAGLDMNGNGQEPPEDPGPQIDRAEELREKWSVELGQMWQLGEHRVVCGDCTDRAVVERVMGGEKAGAVVTDPPYGIGREGIINDKPEDLKLLFNGCLSNLPMDDGVIIAFQSPRLEWVWLDAIRDAGHKLERLLWMYKPNDETFPWHGWLLKSEAIRVSSVGKCEWLDVHPYAQDCYVYKHDETLGDLQGIHTTVKPIRITQDLVSRLGGIVYDPFLGSGTTLIACERLKRKCRGIEIDPGYVAVTLERWHEMTGQVPSSFT